MPESQLGLLFLISPEIMSEVESSLRIKRLKATRACDLSWAFWTNPSWDSKLIILLLARSWELECRKLRTKCQLDHGRDVASSVGGYAYGGASLSPQGRRCVRCTRLNTDCTFILPITETRDRRNAGGHRNSQDQLQDNDITSPMPAHLDPDAAIMPGMTPSIPASINNLELIEYSKEMFGAFLDASMPIVNSREISNHTSVLLNLSVRRLVAAFIEPSNDALDSQIQVSIQKYFENKNSIVVPSTHNIQSLLFLSLFVEELGAGNKFTTAVRMACAMSWNRAFDQLDEDRNYGHGASYIWWSLVSLDTWLYVYSGVPPIIDYTGFNVPKPRRPPKFYRALIGLSEVLRMLVRPESIGEYAEFESALDALASWENSHRAEVYPPDSSDRFENIFDSLALLRILHSVVISLFILQDPLFAVKYSSLHTPEGSRQTSRADGDVIVSNSGILEILIQTLDLHIGHPALFARWGYLQRFSEIVAISIFRLTCGFILPEDIVLGEQNYIVANWRMRCMINEDRWLRILELVGQNRGWEVVLDLDIGVVDSGEDME